MKPLTSLAFAGIAMLVSLFSCSRTSDSSGSTESTAKHAVSIANCQELAEEITDGSYTERILQARTVSGLNAELSLQPESMQASLLLLQDQIGRDIPSNQLTTNEAALLGVRRVGNAVRDPYSIVNYVVQYYEKNQHLPADPADLVSQMMHDSQATIETWSQMSELERVEFADLFAHPVTATLDYSYTDNEWRPLGMSFRVLSSDESIARHKGQDLTNYVREDGMAYVGDFEYILYGETPGKVIFQAVATGMTKIGETGDTEPCGCGE